MVEINIKMPKNCDECPCMIKLFIAYDEVYGCCFTRSVRGKHKKERPYDCPLQERDEDDLK